MSAFTKQQAIDFCKRCYKNDDNECVWHQKNTIDGEDVYATYGCEHAGLDAAKLYCNVCGDAPEKWNSEKKEWVALPFKAVTTSMNNVDKRPPKKTDTKSKSNKKVELPENSVNCSEYHSDMMGCIKHSDCNYCEMPSDGIKDMKCISGNMKSKLEMADVIDAYSCVNKNAFNSDNKNTIDKAGVNSTDYTQYYGTTVPDYTNMNTTNNDETNTINGAGNTFPSFSTYNEYNEPTFNEVKQANEPEEKVVGENEERKKTNESTTTNNNDEDQFFFLGENPTVSESVKYHYDEGYFFDSYTGHGLEFNNNNEIQEYDDNVLKENENKGVESEEEEEEAEQTITNPSNVVEIGENTVVSNTEKEEATEENKDKKTPLNHIKSIVSLQNVVRDMDNTSRMLSYGLVAIFVIMILLFILLTLKK